MLSLGLALVVTQVNVTVIAGNDLYTGGTIVAIAGALALLLSLLGIVAAVCKIRVLLGAVSIYVCVSVLYFAVRALCLFLCRSLFLFVSLSVFLISVFLFLFPSPSCSLSLPPSLSKVGGFNLGSGVVCPACGGSVCEMCLLKRDLPACGLP